MRQIFEKILRTSFYLFLFCIFIASLSQPASAATGVWTIEGYDGFSKGQPDSTLVIKGTGEGASLVAKSTDIFNLYELSDPGPRAFHTAVRATLPSAWMNNGNAAYSFCPTFYFGGMSKTATGSFEFFNDLYFNKFRVGAGSLDDQQFIKLNPSNPPPARSMHAAIWKDSDKSMWVFGGITKEGSSNPGPFWAYVVNDLWKYTYQTNTDGYWTRMTDAPTKLYGHSAVYDDTTGRIFIFGGGVMTGVSMSNTVYVCYTNSSPVTWETINPTYPSPEARCGHVAAWDYTHKVMYIFGGKKPQGPGSSAVTNGCFNDLWKYYPETHTFESIAATGNIPSPRAFAAGDYSKPSDLNNEGIYISGGVNMSFYRLGGVPSDVIATPEDVYVYSIPANTWVKKPPSGVPSPPRYGHTFLMFPPLQDLACTFGGIDDNKNFLAENKYYNPSSWANNSYDGIRPLRSQLHSNRQGQCSTAVWPVAAYNSPTDFGYGFGTGYGCGTAMLNFGGETGINGECTNELSVSYKWIIPDIDTPPNRLVNLRDILSYQDLGTTDIPVLKYATCTHFPPKDGSGSFGNNDHAIVIIGGIKNDGVISNGIYTANYKRGAGSVSFTNSNPFPKFIYGHSTVYADRTPDGVDNGYLLVFGGNDGSAAIGNLYMVDSQWNATDLQPSNPPYPRYFHTAVWDSRDKKMIVVGGTNNGSTPITDKKLWLYDPVSNSWESKAVSGSTRKSFFKASAVWDDVNSKMIVFGGKTGPASYSNELWYYDPASNSWADKTILVPGLLKARGGHSAMWDAHAHRMVIYGGETTDEAGNRTLLNDFSYFMDEDSNGGVFYSAALYNPGNWRFDKLQIHGNVLGFPGCEIALQIGTSETDGNYWFTGPSGAGDDWYHFRPSITSESTQDITLDAQKYARYIEVKAKFFVDPYRVSEPELDGIGVIYNIQEPPIVTVVATTDYTAAIIETGKNGAIATFKLKADNGDATWKSVKFTPIGDNVGFGGDVLKAELFEEASPRRILGTAEFTGAPPYTITFAPPTLPATVDADFAPRYSLVYTLDSNANPGDLVGISIESPSSFTFNTPATANMDWSGPFSSYARISSPKLDVSVEVYNETTATHPIQGQKGLKIFRVEMHTTDLIGGTDWKNITLESMSVHIDPWTNRKDISKIKMYKPLTGPGTFLADPSLVIGEGTFEGSGDAKIPLSESRYINKSAQRIYIACDIAGGALPGDKITLRVPSSAYIKLNGDVDQVSLTPSPALSSLMTIEPTCDNLQVHAFGEPPSMSVLQGDTLNVATLTLYASGDTSVPAEIEKTITLNGFRFRPIGTCSSIDIDGYYVTRNSNIIASGVISPAGMTTVAFTTPEVLPDKSTANYLIHLNVNELAAVGHTIGISAEINSSNVDAPDAVVIDPGVKLFTQNGHLVAIYDKPDALIVTAEAMLNPDTRQGQEVKLVKLTMSANMDEVVLDEMTFNWDGTDWNDIEYVKLFNENFFAVPTLSATKMGSTVTILLSTLQTIKASPKTYYLALKIKSSATPGHSIKLSLNENSFLGVSPDTALPFSLTVGPLPILSAYTPSAPVVDVITPVMDAYTNDSARIRFAWISTAETLGVSKLGYSVGSTKGGSEISKGMIIENFSSPIKPTAKGEISFVPSPALSHGATYYITVQTYAVSGTTYPSVPTETNGTFIDTMGASTPGQPKVSAPTGHDTGLSINLDTNTFTLDWTESRATSEIYQYVLEEQAGVSPVWTNILSPGASPLSFDFTNKPMNKSFAYRVRAQSKAGTWSNYSEVSKNIVIGSVSETIYNVSNYPNPFNSNTESTTITFDLGGGYLSYDVTLQIYDLFGNKVWSAHYPSVGSGTFNKAIWDGTNSLGKKVSKAGYILRITVKAGSKTVVKTRKIGVIH